MTVKLSQYTQPYESTQNTGNAIIEILQKQNIKLENIQTFLSIPS